MPTARELLEQADALMRRNRKRGKGRLGDPPTLSAALGVGEGTVAPTVILPQAGAADPIVLDAPSESRAAANVDPPSPPHVVRDSANDDPISLDTLADVPVLTDVVVPGRPLVVEEDGFVPYAVSPTPLPVAFAERALQTLSPARPVSEPDGLREGDAFPASAAEAQAAAAQLPAPAVIEQEPAEDAMTPQSPPAPSAGLHASAEIASTAAPPLDDEFILEIPPAPDAPKPAAVHDESPIPPVPAPPELSRDGEWGALAEELRMQVLQRLDLFTDTALREQLGARLQPIVDRASAQLVETINRELGELVRGYVAEAIEREIESWRKQSPEPK